MWIRIGFGLLVVALILAVAVTQLAAQDTREAFIQVLLEQLADLTGEEPPALTPAPSTRKNRKRGPDGTRASRPCPCC